MTTNNERRLGPYTIVKKLGEGGMGAVFLGHHRVLEVDHAIKVLPNRLASNPQFVERFLREARSAAKMHHPNIVPVVGCDEENGVRYIAMQFVAGASLEKLARQGGMSVHQAVHYTHQVAQALAFAHSRDMIHRDVKPDNVLVDEDGVAKLTDFGLVRDMSGQAGLTQSGAVLGTPYYMSPEQWRNEGVDHRSDVYALGVMLYYLTSRKYPYPGDAPAVILRNQMDGQPARLDTLNPAVDRALAEIVHRAFHIDIAKRTQTAEEFCASLEQWWATHPDPAGTQLMFAPISSTAGTVRRGPTSRPATSAVAPKPSGIIEPPLPIQPPNSAQTLLVTGQSNAPEFTPAGSAVNLPPPPPPLPTAGGMMGTGTPPSQVVMRDSRTGQMILGQLTESGFVPAGTLVTTGTRSGSPLLIGAVVGAIVVVVAIVAVVLGMQANPGANVAAGPLMTLNLSAADGTMANPLHTRDDEFSIAGQAGANAVITVNGTPYTFGNVLRLVDGMNKFDIQADRDGQTETRTVYVVVDKVAPQLTVPAFAATDDNGDLFTAEREFAIEGTVGDDDAKVMVELVRDGATEMVPVDDDKRFRVVVPVGDAPIRLEMRAVDRAKNRSNPPLVATIVPDRAAPQATWDDADAAARTVWFTTGAIRLSGTVNKVRGVKVASSVGTPALSTADRRFTIAADLPPGPHTIRLTVRDGLSREIVLSRTIMVSLDAPRFVALSPETGATIEVADPKQPIAIRGRLDNGSVALTIDDRVIPVAANGDFSADVVPETFGDFSVRLVAKDPANRVTDRPLRFVVSEKLYEPIGKNRFGFNEFRRLRDGMTVVEIPAGTYTIGATAPADARRTAVRLSAFYIDKFEVDNARYAAFLNAMKFEPDAVFGTLIDARRGADATHRLEYARNQWRPKDGFERHPVTGVTWRGAQDYAKWADPRHGDLPTEPQWEVAARGADQRQYPWGEDEPDASRLNFQFTGTGGTVVVDSYADNGLSPFGVLNMAGNVEEWCCDWYSASAYSGFANALNPAQRDRPEVAGVLTRVVRGGSYESPGEDEPRLIGRDEPGDLRTFARSHRRPDSHASDRGFRVASTRPQ